MGSFNTACFISGLPIMEGDSVRLFLVEQQTRDQGGCICYVHDLCKPITYPMIATYNDYNTYQIPEGQASEKIAVKYIQQNGVKVGVGDNEYHDIAVNPSNFDNVEEMFEAMHEGRLVLNTYRGELPIFHVAIHESVYQKVMAMEFIGWRDKYNLESTYKGIMDAYAEKEKLVNADDEDFSDMIDEIKTSLKAKGKPDEEIAKSVRRLKRTVHMGMDNIFSDRSVIRPHDPYFDTDTMASTKVMEGKIMQHAEIAHLTNIMDEMNLMWGNKMTSGQDREPENQKTFFTTMVAAVESVESEWKQKYSEWDDEE